MFTQLDAWYTGYIKHKHAKRAIIILYLGFSKETPKLKFQASYAHAGDDTYDKHMAFCNGRNCKDPAAVSKNKYYV